MKYLYVSLLSLIFISESLFSQTPINSDFEEWIVPPSKTYEVPVGWNTSNGVIDLNIVNVTKYTDQVNSGSYAVKLESGHLIGLAHTEGTIGIYKYDSSATFLPGSAYKDRPDSITGQFIFYPSFNKKFLSLIYLTKWNGMSRDTIGHGSFIDSDKKETFTRFSYPVQYTSEERPDSILFIISSFGSQWPGTVSIIDNIQFIGDVVKNEDLNPDTEITLFPNPANNQITLKGLKNNTKVEIYDLNGSLLYSDIHDQENSIISTFGYPDGLYLLKTRDFAKLFKVVH
jgi:hypothetical protein